MRIDAYSQIQQIYNTNKSVSKPKAEKTSFRDAVEISSQGKDYQFAKQAAIGAADIRPEVVEPIKSRMANGTYNVSDSDLADKLLEKYSALFA